VKRWLECVLPHAGPVYSGEGYTDMSRALGDDVAVAALLDADPDLVHEVATGGATPLHAGLTWRIPPCQVCLVPHFPHTP
jgi:hypothetical protein